VISIDHTHDPAATCWIPGADAHPDFPVQNLPLGVFSLADGAPRLGTAIGPFILDLSALSAEGVLPAALAPALAAPTLNLLFALPADARREMRWALFEGLTSPAGRTTFERHLPEAADCRLRLPFVIGDYTDFYAGIHHAANIGKQFRPESPLLPNYKYVPIGYHGRASSVQASGVPVFRPKGQRKSADAPSPDYGPAQRLDYELELAVWIAGSNAIGETTSIACAGDRIGGLGLLNDWSARDIQAWEYQPLGPFLAKSFLTTVSPWVVTMEALAPFRRAQPPRPEGDPPPLPYLLDEADQAEGALAIDLEVLLQSARMRRAGLAPVRLSYGPATNLYWTIAQMVAHHTANGCNLNPGDLLGTGTISGAQKSAFGSLTELSEAGRTPLTLPTGELRTFLEDGDEVQLKGTASAPGYRSIGFGPCCGRVAGERP